MWPAKAARFSIEEGKVEIVVALHGFEITKLKVNELEATPYE